MNTQSRGLRLVCPQGCGATLTVPMPTLAEVNESSGDTSLTNLDSVVGRSVVGAVLVHCLYHCTGVSESHPVMPPNRYQPALRGTAANAAEGTVAVT